jgi:RNA polymerase sigma-70 factor (ECF subfamily)
MSETRDGGYSPRDDVRESPDFLTTRWSVVRAAGGASGETHAALASLCEGYWYPLYAFVRRRGYGRDDARDLTQAFFADLLARRDFAALDPALGRFRAWLLAAAKHFLANEADRARAEKRGGGRAPLSIDALEADTRFALEASIELTPEHAFTRGWALALLARTRASLRAEWTERGQGELFAALEDTLTGGTDDPGAEPRRARAERLGLSPGAFDVAAHRLRQRFKERLRAEVAGTLTDPADVHDELAALFAALGRA